MSDTNFAAYEIKCAAVAALQAEVLPSNKQVSRISLFDGLPVTEFDALPASTSGLL